MAWSADIVTEPSREHELCVDLFEDGVHQARVRRNERRELEFVCYGAGFTIPAEWLIGVIERFRVETGSPRRDRA
jgi:hypothetical protein